MVILFLMLLFCAAIVLAAFLVVPPESLKKFYKGGRPRLSDISLKMDPAPQEPPMLHQPDKSEELSAKLKEARENIRKLQEEIDLAKNSESAALEELRKLKVGMEKEASGQESLKKEARELADRLVEKDREYEKEFSFNLNLKKELGEYKEKCGRLESEARQQSEKLTLLEGHVKAYKEELKKHAQIISELNKKDDETQWVSKKEYDALQARLVKEKEDDSKNDEEGSPA